MSKPFDNERNKGHMVRVGQGCPDAKLRVGVSETPRGQGTFDGFVSPGSRNLDLISDRNIPCFMANFRRGL